MVLLLLRVGARHGKTVRDEVVSIRVVRVMLEIRRYLLDYVYIIEDTPL
jgi:hypothetical protein